MWLNWTRIFYSNILHWLKIVKLHFIAATFIKLIIIVSASGDKSDSDDNMIGPAMPPKHSTKAGTIGKENYCVLYSRPTCVTAKVLFCHRWNVRIIKNTQCWLLNLKTLVLYSKCWSVRAGHLYILKWYSGFIFINCDILTIGCLLYH